MSIVNFRVDTNNLKEVVKRLEDNKISMGWGGGNVNLDLRNTVDFRKAYKNITNRRINSIMKIKSFKDGDIIVVPKIPKNGKFIIGFVDGNFPNCYEYVENDQTHLNHCIKLKKVYGLKSELDIHNVENFNRLYGLLECVSDKLVLPKACQNSNPSWFGFFITCKDGIDRNALVQEIESKGVQTRMLFAGNLIKHPCFDEMRNSGEGYRVAGSLDNTNKIMNNSFWIGVYPGMTNEMLDYMANTIIEAVK